MNLINRYSLIPICSVFLISCGTYQYSKPQFSDVSRNEIQLKKVNNFRFLGGIKNTEGKNLKDSIFFRSANLHKLKKGSFRKFSDLRIKTVIDLRTDSEMSKHPDQLPDVVKFEHLAAFNDREDQLNQAKKLVMKGKVNAKDAEKKMLDFYRDYPVEHPEIIKEIIHNILGSEAPVLYHCTAGKDRTGMISMLLLTILKFDKETIYQDYLQSNNQRQKIIEKRFNLAHSLHFLYPKMDIGVLEELSWIKPEFMDETIRSIETKYGSMDNYIHNILGVSEEQREMYIRKFTY